MPADQRPPSRKTQHRKPAGPRRPGAKRNQPDKSWAPEGDVIDPDELADVDIPDDIAVDRTALTTAPDRTAITTARDRKPHRTAEPAGGERQGRGRPGEPRRGPKPAQDAEDPATLIFGIHAIAFALDNPQRIITGLHLTENAEAKLAQGLAGRTVSITRVRPRDLDRRLGPDTVHQGALAEVEPLDPVALDDLIVRAADAGPIVLLDQVTDPHNVGAVLRSCAVFGATGLVMTRRHSPPLGGALAKAASGALELVPVALVQNLANTLRALGAAGVRRIGLDGAGEAPIDRIDWAGPTALVLGAEGKGLRAATRDLCDVIARIPSTGPIASLNVSNAAVVTLYEAQRARA